MLPAASLRSTCALERPTKRRIPSMPESPTSRRCALHSPAATEATRRATAANSSMLLQAADASESARIRAARIGRKPHIKLYHSLPRRRHHRAAAACHWPSKQPTPPVMGLVGCSERPAVSESSSGCRHAVRHASACEVKAAISAHVHAIAPSTTCKPEGGQVRGSR